MTQHSPAAARDSTRRHTVDIPDRLTRRVIVERIRPEIDGGRFPIKRTVGEAVEVTADIFADGHDVVVALLRDREVLGSKVLGSKVLGDPPWRETPMTLVAPGTDEWTARFEVDQVGWHAYQIVAWVDRFLTWRRDLDVKAAAGQDVSIELLEGALLVREAAARAEQIGSGQPDSSRL